MIRMRHPAKRIAAMTADGILAALAPLLTRGSAAGVIPPSPRVLLIRCDHIGDAAMATAVIRPLHDALAPSRLDVLAAPWAAHVFASHPLVDHVVPVTTPWWSAARGARWPQRLAHWAELPRTIRHLRAERYDIGIDLRGDLRHITFFLALAGIPVRVSSDRTGGRRLLTHVASFDASRHEVEKNMAVVSLLGATGHPQLEIPASTDMPAWIRAALDPHGRGTGFVALALRGAAPKRSWPAAHAAALADRLHDELGLASVYVGGLHEAAFAQSIADQSRAGVVNLAGRTTLAESIEVLRAAEATVAVDSGPMHLAAAVGSPVVALFGSSDPRLFRPWATIARIVASSERCHCQGERCALVQGEAHCMRQIMPASVFDAVRDVVSISATKRL
ncbi:MAG: glycosyltransferase family 9 protein [bacterium]